MKGIKHIPLITLVIFLTQCKRDVAPHAIKCAGDLIRADLDDCWPQNFTRNGPLYESPTSNPKNTDELAFVEDGVLVKYNMETKIKTTLVEGLDRILTPDWGASGWIVFSAGWKIWKVRDDGSGLEQISFGPREIWPEFNTDGNQILYPRNMEYGGSDLKNNPELRNDYKMMIIDLDGNPIDSFCRELGEDRCYPWETASWSVNDRIAAEKGPNNDLSVYGLAIYDLDGNELSVPYVVKDRERKRFPFIGDIEWRPNSDEVFFYDSEGLHCLNVDTERCRQIRASCQDEYYLDFTITSDGEHIIAVRRESLADSEICTMTRQFEIVRMKTDGSKEEIIDIP